MDFKLFGMTFVTVLLAELGDKTQIVVLGYSVGEKERFTVFAGAAVALVLATLVAVWLGAALSRFVSPEGLQRVAGVLFLVLGVIYILR